MILKPQIPNPEHRAFGSPPDMFFDGSSAGFYGWANGWRLTSPFEGLYRDKQDVQGLGLRIWRPHNAEPSGKKQQHDMETELC